MAQVDRLLTIHGTGLKPTVILKEASMTETTAPQIFCADSGEPDRLDTTEIDGRGPGSE